MAVDKSKLLAGKRLPHDDVEIEGVGTVTVRGLTRAEVQSVQSQVKGVSDAIKRQAELERQMLALAMVDPELTVAEAGEWQKASVAGEIEPVTDKIQELSRMKDGASKAAYKELESNPDSEFRLPPG